jgi:membrane protein
MDWGHGKIFGLRRSGSASFVHAATFLLPCLIITFVFAAIYKLMPKVRLNWREVSVGGSVTALLFIVGKQLIALYMGKTNLRSAYGAAGSVLVVLLWVYYSAQVFFFGAEFTKVYAETFGSQKEHSQHSEHPSGNNRTRAESGAALSTPSDETEASSARAKVDE